MADFWTSHGYAVVTQDTRARFGSEGDIYEPHAYEALDGYDTIEWAAAQPWSTGSVGTYGQSYLAAVQYMVAPEIAPLTEGADARLWLHRLPPELDLSQRRRF